MNAVVVRHGYLRQIGTSRWLSRVHTCILRSNECKQVDQIDSSTPAGRERLKKIVATLLNSYLAQLLESGFLHADPHP